ncbi:MAG: hypothetical protein QM765_01725 [Myxococcales bacterium]
MAGIRGLFVAVLALGLAQGCKSSHPFCMQADQDPLTDPSACASYSRALCGYQRRCHPAEAEIFSEARFEQCIRQRTSFCEEVIVPRIQRTGSNVMLATLSGACAAAAEAADCSTIVLGSLLPPGCWPPGDKVAGQACASEFECAGQQCDLASLGGCGTCRQLQDEGGACRNNADCRTTPAGDLICRSGSCTRLQAIGEACGLGGCAGFAQCVFDSSGAGVCRKSAQLGEPCATGFQDAPGCDFRQPLRCFEGTCRAVTYVGVGEPCGELENGPARCAGGATCGEPDSELALRATCVAAKDPAPAGCNPWPWPDPGCWP